MGINYSKIIEPPNRPSYSEWMNYIIKYLTDKNDVKPNRYNNCFTRKTKTNYEKS